MMREDDFERLAQTLNHCIEDARAMGLQHAVFLLSMAVMEIADRSTTSGGQRKGRQPAPNDGH
jgi:hypothetical protein